MKAVICARYSSSSQREESIEVQIRECTKFAEQNGYTVLKHYIDKAISGTTDKRPDFQQMIQDSKTHLFDTVLVLRTDRFSRDVADSAAYKQILKNNGVRVIPITEDFGDNAVGQSMGRIMESMAEYYSNELREKVQRGQNINAEKGLWNGSSVPFGLRVSQDHRLEPDPDTAPFVLEAFKRYDAGAAIGCVLLSSGLVMLYAFAAKRQGKSRDNSPNTVYCLCKELRRMTEQVLAVQRMQDYIEKNKAEEISLSDLARASLFSPWYSYRLFRDCLGLTPTEYIRKYRLTQAAKQLRSGDVKVIDAAMDAGFTNVDTFTRAFYREFGLNPSDYMKNPIPVLFFIPYGAKYRELRKENIDLSNIQPIFIQVVRKPERLCIIKRGRQAADYFPYCEEVSCDVWGILMSMKSLCGEPVSMWLPEKYKKPNTSTYVQGVEVETGYMGMIPEGFDIIHLPEAEYLQFQGQPFREEDYCEAIRAVQTAMDSYDPSIIGYRWDDENPRIQLEPRGARGYIELRAVRRVQK